MPLFPCISSSHARLVLDDVLAGWDDDEDHASNGVRREPVVVIDLVRLSIEGSLLRRRRISVESTLELMSVSVPGFGVVCETKATPAEFGFCRLVFDSTFVDTSLSLQVNVLCAEINPDLMLKLLTSMRPSSPLPDSNHALVTSSSSTRILPSNVKVRALLEWTRLEINLQGAAVVVLANATARTKVEAGTFSALEGHVSSCDILDVDGSKLVSQGESSEPLFSILQSGAFFPLSFFVLRVAQSSHHPPRKKRRLTSMWAFRTDAQ